MADGYIYIKDKIMGVPVYGTLVIPDNEYKDNIIRFILELQKEKYFDEYGFSIEILENPLRIYKSPYINDRLRKRFPQINTEGKLIFAINNPDIYGEYDKDNRLELRRTLERERIEESD